VRLPRLQRDRLVDVLVTLVALWFTLAQFGSQGFGDYEGSATEPDGLGFVLVLAAALPLLWRRRAPYPVLVATLAPSFALVALGYGAHAHVATAFALYSNAAQPERGDVWPAIATAAAGYVALIAAQAATLPLSVEDYILPAVIWTGAWLVGDRRRLAGIRQERERELTIADERARIARELHDSAGHAINTIRVQAGAARVLRERDPERSREAIEAIEKLASDTAADIDRIVGALRDEPADLAPAPGVADIRALVEHQRAAGLAVELYDLGGSLDALPASVDRAAYRIAQETLTNAARHGTGRAEVRVERRADALVLDVTNPVADRTPPRLGGGRGIAGMRERAALLGGTLDVDFDDGRFSVRAVLPYDREE
jgi:signal transduction histidine kinase